MKCFETQENVGSIEFGCLEFEDMQSLQVEVKFSSVAEFKDEEKRISCFESSPHLHNEWSRDLGLGLENLTKMFLSTITLSKDFLFLISLMLICLRA